MDTYSREIRPPANAIEGLQNHIQMAINEIEGNNPTEAVLILVDIIDSLYGNGERVAMLKKLFIADANAKAIKDANEAGKEAIETSYRKGFIDGKKAGVDFVMTKMGDAIANELFH